MRRLTVLVIPKSYLLQSDTFLLQLHQPYALRRLLVGAVTNLGAKGGTSATNAKQIPERQWIHKLTIYIYIYIKSCLFQITCFSIFNFHGGLLKAILWMLRLGWHSDVHSKIIREWTLKPFLGLPDISEEVPIISSKSFRLIVHPRLHGVRLISAKSHSQLATKVTD